MWAYFMVPETKGLPLEEIAALFGEADEVTVFSANIHVDHGNHTLVVEKMGGLEPNDKEHGRVSATKVKAEKIEYIEG